MIMISNLVLITLGYYLHCLRRLADQEPRYLYYTGKALYSVALCHDRRTLLLTLVHRVINLKWMVEGQLNPIISIIIDNDNNNKSNDNSNCLLLLLLLKMFYDDNKNLY